MDLLLDKLKNYTLEDAIKIENQDRQFLALKKLYQNKQFSDNLYLFLILANALISFQLSGKGEDYWEEFAENLKINGDFGENNWKWRWMMDNWRLKVYNFFENLLKNGKNNRRFIDMKLKRVKKFLDNFKLFENNSIITDNQQKITVRIESLELRNNKKWKLSMMNKDFCDSTIELNKMKVYYKNMSKLAEDLAKIMNQQKDAKTIVFAVKIFSYWARNVFWYLEYFPLDLILPIDSRLENLYKKYVKEDFSKKEIKQYYQDLAKKLTIPPLHLDAILWVNYEKFFF